MNKLGSFKYSAVLLPVLALGMPMAHAGEIGYQGNSPSAARSAEAATRETVRQGYLNTRPDRGFHSDSLVGTDVTNRRDDEKIGKVSNLVLDEDGQLVAVIVGVGGMLGIGQRDVAIEWSQIERKMDGDDFTLSVDLTEGSLRDAPEYHGDRSQRPVAMTGSDRDTGRQAQSAQERTTTPATPPTSQRATQATANRGSAEYVETLPAAGFHSAGLIGKSVKSHHDDKTIGEVSDLVLDTDGQVVAVVMSIGGIMGIGARDVAIAWDQVERRQVGDETTLWVNLTEQSLKDAPKYTSNPPASRRNR